VKTRDRKRTVIARVDELMILLDTDHFSVLTDARHRLHASLISRLTQANEPVALPVVAVEEQLRAWLAQVNRVRDAHELIVPYGRLVHLLETLAEWEIVPWTEGAANEFTALREQRIRIGTQDLRIAALAVSCDALLLSSNLRDFERVTRLRVEDWLYT
jgi:tRNA(fMet)-specific endonuclease VapC